MANAILLAATGITLDRLTLSISLVAGVGFDRSALVAFGVCHSLMVTTVVVSTAAVRTPAVSEVVASPAA